MNYRSSAAALDLNPYNVQNVNWLHAGIFLLHQWNTYHHVSFSAEFFNYVEFVLVVNKHGYVSKKKEKEKSKLNYNVLWFWWTLTLHKPQCLLAPAWDIAYKVPDLTTLEFLPADMTSTFCLVISNIIWMNVWNTILLIFPNESQILENYEQYCMKSTIIYIWIKLILLEEYTSC